MVSGVPSNGDADTYPYAGFSLQVMGVGLAPVELGNQSDQVKPQAEMRLVTATGTS